MERLPLPARLVRPLGYPRVAALPEDKQRGLRAFWLDGLFSAIASAFTDPYYTLYLLSLGASNFQIGLASTLNQLAGAAMAMPGAVIADRTGRYKRLVLIGGVLSRAMWPVMLVAPWLPAEPSIWLVLVAWVGVAAFGMLGNAAWTALSADLVPPRLRGGYFASRNIVIHLAQLAFIPLAGQLVNVIGEPGGYQVNLALALLFGAGSIYFYSRLPEHPPSPKADTVNTLVVLRRLRTLPNFVRFATAHAILNLGVLIAGPFIRVYMAQEAGFDVGTIGLATTVNVLVSLVAMRLMGPLQDRFGILWTMRFGLGIPLIPVLWLGVSEPWQAYLVEIYSGLTWAGYNLGAFNLLLASTPDEHRPRYVAIHVTLISVVGAIGPALGGWLLDLGGFPLAFSSSTVLRALALMLFFALVREPEKAAEAAT